jgi:predicted permease
LLQDFRYTWRLMRRAPAFTLVTVLTVALAIGGNAIVFAAVNTFLLHPLNVPAADSLYTLERGKDRSTVQSYPDYTDIRARNRSFDDLAAFDIGAVAIGTGDGEPTRHWMYDVSANYFDEVRVKPYLGRFFHASDDRGPNSAPYVVLSYTYWRTQCGSDRSAIGRTVLVNRQPFTIVGVAPSDFVGTLMFFRPDVYLPMVDQELIYGENLLNARNRRWISWVIGHLKPGVTRTQAIADLNIIGANLGKMYPREDGDLTFTIAHPWLGNDDLEQALRAFLTGVSLLAALILLAACANLGSLFAARAADRSRELAMRIALGAGRLRIGRQLFTESLVISLLGGAVGVWASMLVLGWLSKWRPFPMYPVQTTMKADATVYAVALMLSVVSGLLFGAVPVRHVLRTDPYANIKSGTRATGDRRFGARDVLLGIQIAICAVLVTSSLVAVRGLLRSLQGSFGIDPQNVVLLETDLKMAGYNGEARLPMQKRIMEAMSALPGVSSVGFIDVPPLSSVTPDSSLIFSDGTSDFRPANARADAVTFKISPEYLQTAGTSLLAGRSFTWHDDMSAPRVGIVNRELAKKVFGSPDKALGSYFKREDGTRVQVVGIAEDGKYGSMTEDPQPAVYMPLAQWPSGESFIVVRSAGDWQPVATAMRTAVHRLDPGLPVSIHSWSDTMRPAQFGARMAAISLGVLGIIAAMLAITGIFGTAAYSVSRRMKELGIRVALGAQPREVLKAALGPAVTVLGFGSTAGLVLGLMASRVLAWIVYQATPRDPVVMAGVVLMMTLLGLLATWIPARRALSIDPIVLLRHE